MRPPLCTPPARTIAGTLQCGSACTFHLRAIPPQGRPDPCAPSQGAPRSGGGCIVVGHPVDPDRSDVGTTPSLPLVGSPLRGGTRALPRQREVRQDGFHIPIRENFTGACGMSVPHAPVTAVCLRFRVHYNDIIRSALRVLHFLIFFLFLRFFRFVTDCLQFAEYR